MLIHKFLGLTKLSNVSSGYKLVNYKSIMKVNTGRARVVKRKRMMFLFNKLLTSKVRGGRGWRGKIENSNKRLNTTEIKSWWDRIGHYSKYVRMKEGKRGMSMMIIGLASQKILEKKYKLSCGRFEKVIYNEMLSENKKSIEFWFNKYIRRIRKKLTFKELIRLNGFWGVRLLGSANDSVEDRQLIYNPLDRSTQDIVSKSNRNSNKIARLCRVHRAVAWKN